MSPAPLELSLASDDGWMHLEDDDGALPRAAVPSVGVQPHTARRDTPLAATPQTRRQPAATTHKPLGQVFELPSGPNPWKSLPKHSPAVDTDTPTPTRTHDGQDELKPPVASVVRDHAEKALAEATAASSAAKAKAKAPRTPAELVADRLRALGVGGDDTTPHSAAPRSTGEGRAHSGGSRWSPASGPVQGTGATPFTRGADAAPGACQPSPANPTGHTRNVRQDLAKAFQRVASTAGESPMASRAAAAAPAVSPRTLATLPPIVNTGTPGVADAVLGRRPTCSGATNEATSPAPAHGSLPAPTTMQQDMDRHAELCAPLTASGRLPSRSVFTGLTPDAPRVVCDDSGLHEEGQPAMPALLPLELPRPTTGGDSTTGTAEFAAAPAQPTPPVDNAAVDEGVLALVTMARDQAVATSVAGAPPPPPAPPAPPAQAKTHAAMQPRPRAQVQLSGRGEVVDAKPASQPCLSVHVVDGVGGALDSPLPPPPPPPPQPTDNMSTQRPVQGAGVGARSDGLPRDQAASSPAPVGGVFLTAVGDSDEEEVGDHGSEPGTEHPALPTAKPDAVADSPATTPATFGADPRAAARALSESLRELSALNASLGGHLSIVSTAALNGSMTEEYEPVTFKAPPASPGAVLQVTSPPASPPSGAVRSPPNSSLLEGSPFSAPRCVSPMSASDDRSLVFLADAPSFAFTPSKQPPQQRGQHRGQHAAWHEAAGRDSPSPPPPPPSGHTDAVADFPTIPPSPVARPSTQQDRQRSTPTDRPTPQGRRRGRGHRGQSVPGLHRRLFDAAVGPAVGSPVRSHSGTAAATTAATTAPTTAPTPVAPEDAAPSAVSTPTRGGARSSEASTPGLPPRPPSSHHTPSRGGVGSPSFTARPFSSPVGPVSAMPRAAIAVQPAAAQRASGGTYCDAHGVGSRRLDVCSTTAASPLTSNHIGLRQSWGLGINCSSKRSPAKHSGKHQPKGRGAAGVENQQPGSTALSESAQAAVALVQRARRLAGVEE